MLHGLTTITHYVDDIPAAIAWYRKVLGLEPNFLRPDAHQPAYAEFRIGPHEDELGFIDRRYAPADRTLDDGSRTTAYWHVDDVATAHERLLAEGATTVEPVVEREAGFVTAAVRDPFGNVLGLMHSPHWLQQA